MERRNALRDFPPDPTDSRVGLWIQVGQEGPRPLVLGGLAWSGQPSPKCPLGGSRGSAMEPRFPGSSLPQDPCGVKVEEG